MTAAEVTLLWAPADPVAGAPSSAAYVIHFTALCPSELQHLAAAYALVNFMDCFAPLALETRFTLVDFDYNFDGSAVCGQLHFDEHLKPVYDWAVSRCQAFDGGDFSFYGDLPACSWGLPVQESAGGSFTSSLENLLEQTRCASTPRLCSVLTPLAGPSRGMKCARAVTSMISENAGAVMFLAEPHYFYALAAFL